MKCWFFPYLWMSIIVDPLILQNYATLCRLLISESEFISETQSTAQNFTIKQYIPKPNAFKNIEKHFSGGL